MRELTAWLNNFAWLLVHIIAVFVFIAFVGVVGWKVKEIWFPPDCSIPQLHEVIEKVEACTKSKVICSSDDKDKILREVCGK